MFQFLFEVSPYVEKILKKIENNFNLLKKDPKNKKIWKKMENDVKTFTGVNQVIFKVKPNIYNAMVLPMYNGVLFRKASVEQIKKLMKDDSERSKYVKQIYIMFGDKLLKDLTAAELTAVLLHEIGHVYQHTTHVFDIMRIVIKSTTIFFPILFLLAMRTLSIFDHKYEYNSDKFAAKYGYGDEMISALNKIKKKEDQYNKKQGKVKTFFMKIIRLIYNSHPDTKKRICKVADDVFKEYRDLYPEMSTEILLTLRELKCKNIGVQT